MPRSQAIIHLTGVTNGSLCEIDSYEFVDTRNEAYGNDEQILWLHCVRPGGVARESDMFVVEMRTENRWRNASFVRRPGGDHTLYVSEERLVSSLDLIRSEKPVYFDSPQLSYLIDLGWWEADETQAGGVFSPEEVLAIGWNELQNYRARDRGDAPAGENEFFDYEEAWRWSLVVIEESPGEAGSADPSLPGYVLRIDAEIAKAEARLAEVTRTFEIEWRGRIEEVSLYTEADIERARADLEELQTIKARFEPR